MMKSLDCVQGPVHDRRASEDRRLTPTPLVSRFLLRGARRAGRRAEEQAHVYVDRPGRWAAGAFVALLALSVVDADLTLRALSDGGDEANPIMRATLALGSSAFVILKLAAMSLCAAFLCLHRKWALARAGLWIALAAYVLVLLYHLYGQLALA